MLSYSTGFSPAIRVSTASAYPPRAPRSALPDMTAALLLAGFAAAAWGTLLGLAAAR